MALINMFENQSVFGLNSHVSMNVVVLYGT